jgi:hypothetical protein
MTNLVELTWPGLTRPSTSFVVAIKNVDAWRKAGHDGELSAKPRVRPLLDLRRTNNLPRLIRIERTGARDPAL